MSEATIGDNDELPSAAMEDVPVRKRRMAPGEAAGTRNEDDAYDTPEALALACTAWVSKMLPDPTDPARGPPLILEPCAGKGPFVKAARMTWPGSKVVAVDIRPECEAPCLEAGAVRFAHLDSLTLSGLTIAAADLTVSNPPFKHADELARHFWAHMKDGAVLAFLLSVTFIGSKDRWQIGDDPDVSTPDARDTRGIFTIAPLAYMVPIVPRPDFGPTSPKFEVALFVWVKGMGWGAKEPEGATIPPDPIRWVKPKRTRAKKGENGSAP